MAKVGLEDEFNRNGICDRAVAAYRFEFDFCAILPLTPSHASGTFAPSESAGLHYAALRTMGAAAGQANTREERHVCVRE